MNTTKSLSLLTAASVLAVSVCGCSMLGGKDKAAIEEVASSYIDYIKGGKLNKSAALVADEEDYFQENAFPVQQEDLLSVLWDSTEYEVENIEVNKNSASAEIVFTMPDLESIADEGYSFTEFLDAIGDIDETVEETVEFEFTKDGDEWLIEGDSTEDFFNFLAGIGEDLEFGLSEAAAVEAVDTFIALLAQGDLDGAVAMSPTAGDDLTGYAEAAGFDNYNSWMGDVLAAYFSNLSYETEVIDVTDDAITVQITGTAPDAETAVSERTNDVNVMAPIAADYIEAQLNGNMDIESLIGEIFVVVADAINTADSIPYTSTAVVTADEAGNPLISPASDFMLDFDFPDFISGDDVLPAALDLLLEQGRITAEQYAMFAGEVPAGDYDVTAVVAESGDDYYNYNVFVSEEMVELHVQTWAYYDEGDIFNYIAEYNGLQVTGQCEIQGDHTDILRVSIPVLGNNGPYGNYVVTVFDEGLNNTSVLCEIEIIVLEQGAPVTGEIGFGESMTYDEVSDDFYTFHFVDGNGSWFTDDVYPSNRGSVDFYAMTWDYYDIGETIDCDVYLDGNYVDTITLVNDTRSNDTFEFSYEPAGGLESGDYTFVIHDVGESSILVIAYATVDDVN